MCELFTQAKFYLPEIILIVCGLVVLGIELTRWKAKNIVLFLISSASLILVLAVLVFQLTSDMRGIFFYQAWIINPLAIYGKLVVTLAALLTVMASLKYVEIHELNWAEYVFMLIASVSGMFVLLSANDFIILFLGLELISFPIYILTGMKVKNERSCEASLKYIVMGAFSSAILLFGIALIYGAMATTNLMDFTAKLAANPIGALLALGLTLALVGFCFKLSIVPFHTWTPDVYEGAPTTITAFMSVTIKVAVFFVFFRLFVTLNNPTFVEAIAFLALLSILVGNFYGLLQSNVKRLIAYSSIAHAGYILLGFLDPNRTQGTCGMMFYVLNYTLMNLAALFVLVYLTTKDRYVETIQDLKGVAWRQPFLGFVMLVAMFSLAGLPPTPGFLAKFYIFKSALAGGYIITVVLALVSTLISLYYYAKILAVMYMEETCSLPESKEYPLPLAITLGLVTAGLFYLGLFPDQMLTQILTIFNS